MTDLTAAQFVAQMERAVFDRDADEMRNTVAEILEHMAAQETREGRMWRRVPKNLLARIAGALARKETLIEQQAFLLAAMHEDRMRASLLIDLKANEVAALRKVIEDAPHSEQCDSLYGSWMDDEDAWHHQPCTCWKAKAHAG